MGSTNRLASAQLSFGLSLCDLSLGMGGLISEGFLKIGKWRGAPIRIHWSTPLVAYVFGGFQIRPAFFLGFVLLVLIHELGHALVVVRVRGTVQSIDIMGIGGRCTWTGEVSRFEQSCIAWGGVGGQLVLFGAARLMEELHGPPGNLFMAQMMRVFTVTNLWVIALNLLPFHPLDGAEAWPIVPMLWRRFRKARSGQRFTRKKAVAHREMRPQEVIEANVSDEAPPEVQSMVRKLFEDLKKDPTDPK